MNSAPLFALALLASLTPAHAQVQTPAAGYHGIEIPNRPQPRPPAERARDRSMAKRLNSIAPASGGDPNVPHILHIGRKTQTDNLGAGKHPVMAQPFGNDRPRGTPFVVTSIMSSLTMQEFGDLPACEASARWWLDILDPDEMSVACLPKRMRP